MVRMHLGDFTPSTRSAFRPIPFVEKLNRLLHDDPLGEKFAFSLLLLDPLKDLATLLSCGLGDLLHVPQGHTEPRQLSSPNDLLGQSHRHRIFRDER